MNDMTIGVSLTQALRNDANQTAYSKNRDEDLNLIVRNKKTIEDIDRQISDLQARRKMLEEENASIQRRFEQALLHDLSIFDKAPRFKDFLTIAGVTSTGQLIKMSEGELRKQGVAHVFITPIKSILKKHGLSLRKT